MSRTHRWILLTLLLGVFMGALDIFIVAPALSAIQAGLHLSARLATWSFTAYTLVLVVTQPLVATLSDRLGRRWVYVGSVALFALGSALCAVAPGFGLFILGRGVQAVGAGGVLPVASAVIADTFPPARRGAALGIVGSVFGLAFIVGPLVGSWLTGGAHLGGLTTDWHAIFVVNLPIAAVIIALAARWLPVAAPRQSRGGFDWYGAVLLALALFCLIFGLTQVDFTSLSANFSNEAAAPVVILGLALLVPFWLHERVVAAPIVDVRVFSRRQLLIAMGLSVGAGIVTSSVVYVPQLVGGALHLRATADGGFYLTWVALALTLGTPLTGRLIDRVGPRAVLVTGGLVTATALTLLLAARSDGGAIVAALLLLGLGLATFVGTPLRYIVVNEAPAHRRAASLAVLTVCNTIGQTIILPLGGAVIASTIAQTGATTPAARDAATFAAIHVYYALVLALVAAATLLALGLQTRAQESAARRPAARPARPATAQRPAPAERDASERHPAISAR